MLLGCHLSFVTGLLLTTARLKDATLKIDKRKSTEDELAAFKQIENVVAIIKI